MATPTSPTTRLRTRGLRTHRLQHGRPAPARRTNRRRLHTQTGTRHPHIRFARLPTPRAQRQPPTPPERRTAPPTSRRVGGNLYFSPLDQMSTHALGCQSGRHGGDHLTRRGTNDERDPDGLAAIRQDVATLRSLLEELADRLAPQQPEESGRPARVVLKLVPVDRRSDRPS